MTCFEVVEHLSTFLALLEWSAQLAREHARDVRHQRSQRRVLVDPESASTQPSWGEGAFEELCRLLPPEHTLLRQVALGGSAARDGSRRRRDTSSRSRSAAKATVATHFIAAFGPRHASCWRGALAAQTDMLEQRRWERQRESELAFAGARGQARRGGSRCERDDRRAGGGAARADGQFDEWRAYIHELERELGRPLVGRHAGRAPAADADASRRTEPRPTTAPAEPTKPPT